MKKQIIRGNQLSRSKSSFAKRWPNVTFVESFRYRCWFSFRKKENSRSLDASSQFRISCEKNMILVFVFYPLLSSLLYDANDDNDAMLPVTPTPTTMTTLTTPTTTTTLPGGRKEMPKNTEKWRKPWNLPDCKISHLCRDQRPKCHFPENRLTWWVIIVSLMLSRYWRNCLIIVEYLSFRS